MVDFVDVFVDPAMMQQPMQEVVPGVFNHSTAKTLSQNIWPEEGDQKWKSAPSVVLVQQWLHQQTPDWSDCFSNQKFTC